MIQLHCEICNKMMTANTDYKKIRDWIQAKGTQCGECVKMQQMLLGFAEKKKGYVMARIEKLVVESQKQIQEEIKNMIRDREEPKNIVKEQNDGERNEREDKTD